MKTARYSFLIILLSMFVAITGCDKKEKPAKEDKPAVVDDKPQVPPEPPKPTAPDLKGEWKGSLFNHPSILKITQQTDNEFKGTITTTYRRAKETTNVTGSINAETKEISMMDDIPGKFTGTLNSDGSIIEGSYKNAAASSKFKYTKQ